MILRSGKLLNMATGDSTDKSNSVVENTDMENYIAPFDPDAGMQFASWILYFENNTQSKEKDWKIRNISKFLKGKALTTYINSCLDINDWEILTNLLKEKFILSSNVTFGEFNNTVFKFEEGLDKYFHNKVEIGRKLGLNNSLIIEGLTDGLPNNLKPMLVINPPTTPIDWFTKASALISVQKHGSDLCKPTYQNNTPKNERPVFVRPKMPYQFRQNFSPFSQNRQHYPQPQFRQWRPVSNNGPRNEFGSNGQFFNNRSNNQTNHHQQYSKLPSRPCRNCQNFGILNAYHWEQMCTLTEKLGNMQLNENESELNNAQNNQNSA